MDGLHIAQLKELAKVLAQKSQVLEGGYPTVLWLKVEVDPGLVTTHSLWSDITRC
jgi:hypothetical protein